ncbi:MAG: CpaF family protein [Methylotetracoccus sp.]
MSLRSRLGMLGQGKRPDAPVEPADGEVPNESRVRPADGESQGETKSLELPVLTDRELEFKERIHQVLLEILDLSLIGAVDQAQARKQIRETALRLFDEHSCPLSAQSRFRVCQLIEDDILGLGPLEPLLAEPSISDILVNGCRHVFVERYGKLEATPLRFASNEHLLKIIDRIVSSVGRRVDESSPMVDARLKDGSRVNVIIPPLALDGPILSIRRFMKDRMQLDDLVGRTHSLSSAISVFLKAAVRGRTNLIISGGTGSGKTTLLNALSQYIPRTDRIITIEDSAELQLRQEHVVRLETRPPNIEGRGEVTQRDLVRNCLRMRPDRIVVGEVRGEEAFDMLQAMNTGHDGSLTTVHANGPRDALSRVENMISMAGFELPIRAVRSQIASAVHLVVHLERMEDGVRRVTSVQEIHGMEGDVITMSEIFRFDRRGLDEHGRVLGTFVATGVVPRCHDVLHRKGVEIDIDIYNPERRI